MALSSRDSRSRHIRCEGAAAVLSGDRLRVTAPGTVSSMGFAQRAGAGSGRWRLVLEELSLRCPEMWDGGEGPGGRPAASRLSPVCPAHSGRPRQGVGVLLPEWAQGPLSRVAGRAAFLKASRSPVPGNSPSLPGSLGHPGVSDTGPRSSGGASPRRLPTLLPTRASAPSRRWLHGWQQGHGEGLPPSWGHPPSLPVVGMQPHTNPKGEKPVGL